MILITGATGFVGAHLTLHLVENKESVRAIYRHESAIAKTKKLFEKKGKLILFDQIEWMQADITDLPRLEKAFDQISKVYHCAGIISFDPADEELMRKTNIEGTANVVNLCLALGVQRLCFMSSIATIGSAPISGMACDETHEWNPELPHTDYAISKYGAEMEVWRGFQEGLSVLIVNPGVILGPYFWDEGSGLFFSKIAKKFPFFGKGSTGFIGISDVIAALTQLDQSGNSGERYILVSENRTYESICKEIAQNLAVSIRWMALHKWMLGLAWRLDLIANLCFGKKRKISKQLAKSIGTHLAYSSAKINRENQFSFTPIAQVIRETAQAYRSN